MFKILHLSECAVNRMEPGRGEQIKLINSTLNTENVDVHLNRLVPGGPRGKVHHHTKTDNVYIVKRGEGTLTVEGETHIIREDDVVFIPAGMKHGYTVPADKPALLISMDAPPYDPQKTIRPGKAAK